MTPAARVQAAIEVLDDILAGQAAEQALSRWARRSRFAGSKDRAAVRDHVFDALRCKRSAGTLGGGHNGRAIMLGLVRAQAADADGLFNGDRYAPAALSAAEAAFEPHSMSLADRWNLPDWIVPHFQTSLGDHAEETALLLQQRGPVSLRVNRRRGTLKDAVQALQADGIEVEPVATAPDALRVTAGARAIRRGAAFLDGLVELQDIHSQAVVAGLPEPASVLDICAGGGGKSLALADQYDCRVFASDIDVNRMKDIPERAKRAQVSVTVLAEQDRAAHAPYDVVLCDAPCSGSGAWRRAPEAKWALTPDRLAELTRLQSKVLSTAVTFVAPHGTLVYATCSVLAGENEHQVEAFLAQHPDWQCVSQHRYPVTQQADGFFVAHLKR
ncbi:MAG: RsmB/NOP family class I SAM-dependent RNA methyltransferase [Roseobacter sp.]